MKILLSLLIAASALAQTPATFDSTWFTPLDTLGSLGGFDITKDGSIIERGGINFASLDTNDIRRWTVQDHYSVVFSDPISAFCDTCCAEGRPTSTIWKMDVDSIEVNGKVIRRGKLKGVRVYYRECVRW